MVSAIGAKHFYSIYHHYSIYNRFGTTRFPALY